MAEGFAPYPGVDRSVDTARKSACANLLRQEGAKNRIENLHESDTCSGCVRRVAVGNRDGDLYQRCVAAMIADGIHHHPEFRRVFVGDDAAAALIPIQSDALVVSLRHDIAVDLDGRRLAWDRDLGISVRDLLPAGAGQT